MIVAYIDGGARGNPGPAGVGVRIEQRISQQAQQSSNGDVPDVDVDQTVAAAVAD